VEGARITFQVEAHDESELIARGVHRLHVIRVAGFAKRVRQKTLPRRAVISGVQFPRPSARPCANIPKETGRR